MCLALALHVCTPLNTVLNILLVLTPKVFATNETTLLFTTSGARISCGELSMRISSDTETRRSHTGYCLFLNGGPISWKSTRQQSVSLSTAEAEWYAASEAGKEIVYLRHILEDFGLKQRGQRNRHYPLALVFLGEMERRLIAGVESSV